jgi:anti-anti-sigma factor
MEISTRRAGSVLVVALQGELDAYWAGETERELWGQMDRGYHCLALDLSGLRYLSTGGLRALLRGHQRLSELHGKLALAAPQPYVRDVLTVSGLAQALTIYDTLQEALDALKADAAEAGDGWAGAVAYTAAHGAYELLRCTEGRGVLEVAGEPADLLYSRATAERLTSPPLAELGYGLAIGAPAESAAAAVERLGEMLTLPGSVFWVPGDERQAADYLTADRGGARVAAYVLNGIWLQGRPQFYGRFIAADGERGATLDDWARGLLDWAAQAPAGGARAVGVALRAELAEMWGVALKRAPVAGRAPANGQEISHRENIADWLHFPTEPAFANYTLLAAGVAAANTGRPLGGRGWEAVFGGAEGGAAYRLHLHGAAFRPVPELGGAAILEEEIGHVAGQGELTAVAHLLPTTRVRSALFGVWVL